MTITFKLILLFICGLFITCTTRPDKTLQKNATDNFIDSLKLKSNKAEILFYVDFLKSKMEISNLPFIDSKAGLDTIFHYIGNVQNDSCFLHSTIIPDGEIKFYKDKNVIADIQFVLTDTCSGFYNDFTKNSKRYKLTKYGDTILSNIKSKLFK